MKKYLELTYVYYTPIDLNKTSDDNLELAEALYADNDHSFYCPSPNKFPINRDNVAGLPA